MCSRPVERTARLLAAATFAIVSGCGVRQVGEGAPPEGKARFPVVAVVSLFSDKGRAGGEIFDASAWDIGGKATRIVSETLSAAGGSSVAVGGSALGSELLTSDEPGWESRAIARLRANGQLPAGTPVLMLRQSRMNETGLPLQESPRMSRAAGYATTGLFAIAAVAALAAGTGAWILIPADPGDPFGMARRRDDFEQAITLRKAGGQTVCGAGVEMRMLGPDGAMISSADNVLGQEVLPRHPAAERWSAMASSDRAMVEAWCVASLRRTILLAVRAAGVVQ